MTRLLEIHSLVPDSYREWRPLVDDSVLFLIEHLSSLRLANKFVEQLELPSGTPAPFRVLGLFTRVPGLQKLGQVLARNRHLTPQLRAALSQLENSISDVEFESIRRIVEEDLAGPIREWKIKLDDAPLAEATVSAVVGFTWCDPEAGRERRGVFKVRKPYIPDYFAEDMELFQQLSAFLSLRIEQYGAIVRHLPKTFQEVRLLLEHEVDFRGEQRTLAEAKRFYGSLYGVRVPEVIESLCSDRITAMTEECSTKITDATTPSRQRAEQLVGALLTRPLLAAEPQALIHADPHAGNLMYDDAAQQLVLLDWALVEHLTLDQRRHTLLLTIMLNLRDKGGVWREVQILSGDPSAHTGHVEHYILSFVSDLPILKLAGSLDAMQLLDGLASQGVTFPPALLMFRKAMFTLDGVLHDITGPEANLDSLLRNSFMSQLGQTWPALFSLPDLVAIQSSAMFYGARLWMDLLSAVPLSGIFVVPWRRFFEV
jgi:ubiquinone biosynthesis protein